MRRPALAAAIVFSIGVLAGTYINVPVSWLMLLSAAYLVLGATGFFLNFRPTWMTAILLCALMAMGMARLRQEAQRKVDHRLLYLAERETVCELAGSVLEEPQARGEDHLIQARIERVALLDTVFNVRGVVLIRFKKFRPRMEYGDRFNLVAMLRRPSPARNPGAFDYRKFIERKGISATATVRKPDEILELEEGEGTWLWSIIVLPVRRRIREAIDQNLTGAPAGLLKGVLLGEKRGVPEDVSLDFARAGVNHVLAVSGLHVGLIATVVFSLLRAVGAGRSLTVWFTVAALALYALITGLPASVLRASTMASVVILGMLGGREGDGLNTLGVAGLGLLFVNPMDLFDVGFQLSFSATAAIMILHKPIRSLFPCHESSPFGKYLLTPLAVSFAAQAGTAPLVATYFGHLSIVSLAANLVIVPLIAGAVALGIAAILSSLVSEWLATYFNGANWVILQGAIHSAEWMASPTWAYVEVPKPGWALSGIYVSSLLVLVPGIRSHFVGKYILFFLLLLTNVGVWSGIVSKPTDLEMVVLDVGQGDGIFLWFPNGLTMLVDGGLRGRGYDAGERVVLPFLRERGVQKIDVVVASHPHSDHIGGLVTILERCAVGHYLDAGQFYGSWTANRIRELVKEKGIKYVAVAAGDSLLGLGGVGGVILHPSRHYVSPTGEAPHGLNNGSVVLRLSYGESSILLTGDIEHETDSDLLRWTHRLESDVLKAAHHGSRTSSTQNFLAGVKSKLALVSCGVKNKFRHPAPEVIARYKKLEMEVARTDRSGAIILQISKDEIRVTKWLNEETIHVVTK